MLLCSFTVTAGSLAALSDAGGASCSNAVPSAGTPINVWDCMDILSKSNAWILPAVGAPAAPVKLAEQRAKADADVSRPNPVARRAERMAMLDAKLLDDSTMGDLSARAARERKGGR